MSDISIRGVAKAFVGRPPVRALDGIDLDVAARTITAVLGPSGCGKTTLLRVIAGFERPDVGTVTIAGDTVAGPSRWVPPERRRIGIVPQEGALFPHLDVAGNIAFALQNRRSSAARSRVAELLELVGLVGYDRRRPHELSGGQQQRVALARALAARPAVVLLDEPFTALDQGLRARLRADVAAVVRHEEATAVIVTHDPGEALSFADHIAVMAAGRIVQADSSRSVYQSPADAPTAAMLGEVEVVPGRIVGGVVTTRLGEVALPRRSGELAPSDGDVDVVLRPEQIRSRPGGVKARVDSIEFHGHDGIVTLVLDGGGRDGRDEGPVVRARWSVEDLPERGDVVAVGIVGPALLLVPTTPG